MNERPGGKQPKSKDWTLHQVWGPTVVGSLWIVFSIMLLVQGLLRGFNLVSFIASFLIAMWALNMLVTLFSGPRLRKLQLKRRLLGSVHVGTPVIKCIEVVNQGYSNITGVLLAEQGKLPNQTFGLSRLAGQGRVEFRCQAIPTCRGAYTWKPLIISTGNPFGLFRMMRDCPKEEVESLVLPILGEIDQQQFQRWLRHSRRASSLQTRVRAKRTVTPADFYGIRSYRPGDSARWIHWRTTARVGTPMVREFEEPPQDHITVILDASLPDTEENLQAGWLAARKKNMKVIKQHYRQYSPPTQEELAFKLAELRQSEAPYSDPLHRVEQAVSLACSLCYLWTRRLGSTISLVVLDGRPDLPIRFESGPNLRHLVLLMERLAAVKAIMPQDMSNQVQSELDQRAFTPGPVIMITPGVNSQARSFTAGVNRPVQVLDVSKARQLRRFFHSEAKAVLKDKSGQEFTS